LQSVVLNADDVATKEVLKGLSATVKSCVYKASAIPNDVCELFGRYCLAAVDLLASAQGTSFKVKYKSESYALRSYLLGEFNVANLLLCIQVMQTLEFSFQQVLASVESLVPPPGRLQRVESSDELPAVVIDYAHTPDALESVLRTLKFLKHDELVAVFGCGGDRDAGKRPLMGAIAEALADKVILTDDNPRNESSAGIIKDILAGLKVQEDVLIITNRAKAIKQSIQQATKNDIVLIAGKGHEDYQVINGQKTYFSDYEQAVAALQARRAVA